MLPTLEDGEVLLVKRYTSLERGDVVIVKYNGTMLVKRIIGMPGERVTIHDGRVCIDGTELQEDYLYDNRTSGECECSVPDASYFVMGDNRYSSYDSRDIGTVSKECMIGKVIFSWSSLKTVR